MCGFVGIVGEQENSLSRIDRGLKSIKHRGPDSSGLFSKNRVHLGHNRLKIIDLTDAGTQPFYSKDGRFILVFNGEIFNYLELRKELQNEGVEFKTNTDTEVLLELLISQGVKVLDKLNGFWAFAFYDSLENKILLCRDRLGVKPLFYSLSKKELLFASEVKALFAMGVHKSIEEEHLDEQLFYRSISGENTVFKNVLRVLPGSLLKIDVGNIKISSERWFHLGEKAKSIEKVDNPYEWFEAQFKSAIENRMVSDVSVGTLLSGGLDSSSVLFQQDQLGYSKDISTWNIAFSNKNHDESDLAKKFSEDLNIPFNSYEFDGDELYELTVEALKHHDEPLMHVQEPHILGLSKKAKQKVTVLLSGEASDELLGGYVRYKIHDKQLRYKLLKTIKYIPNKYLSNPRWQKIKKYLEVENQPFQMMGNANNIFLSDLENNNVHGFNLLQSYRVEVLTEAEKYFPNSRLRQLMYMDHFLYIPTLNDRNDRMTMAASIECREPFQDKDLLLGVWSLDDNLFHTKRKGKNLLMETIGKKLPEFITNHRKVGLSIPWSEIILNNKYFKKQLDKMAGCEIFNMGRLWQFDIEKLVNDFKNGNRQDLPLFLQLYFLAFWYEVQFN